MSSKVQLTFSPKDLLSAYKQTETAPEGMLKAMEAYPLNQIVSTYAVTPITLLQNPYHVRNSKMPTHGNLKGKPNFGGNAKFTKQD
jgi:hypothetical protein